MSISIKPLSCFTTLANNPFMITRCIQSDPMCNAKNNYQVCLLVGFSFYVCANFNAKNGHFLKLLFAAQPEFFYATEF